MNQVNLKAIEALENWWNSKPAEGVRPPKQCFVQEDKVAAIWLSAWKAAEESFSKGIKNA